MHFIKINNVRLLILLVITCAPVFQLGCSSPDSAPYYTAIVTSVYNDQTTVEHFSLLYWWEERGETPFLKPYNLTAKELIVEVLSPSKDDAVRVTLITERIPFDGIKIIDIGLTNTGKQIIITTKDGRRIVATTNFPNILKKDSSAGFADNTVFVQGKKNENGILVDFKLGFDFIKKIVIVNKTDL